MDKELVNALRLYLSRRGAKQALLEQIKREGYEISPSLLSQILSGKRPLAGHLEEVIRQVLGLKEEERVAFEAKEKKPGFFWDFLYNYLDSSDIFRKTLQKREWDRAWNVAVALLRGWKDFLPDLSPKLSWVRVRVVEDALLATSLACIIDALGPAALFLLWARREALRISLEDCQDYIRLTDSCLDAELFQCMLDLNLMGTEASFYQNLRNWRQAYERREQILNRVPKLKLPEPLAAYYQVGAQIGQLLVLPRIPRFSIRGAIQLVEQIRRELDVRDWTALTEIPGFPAFNVNRFRAEARFYAHRGFLMACARYGGDWIRTGERIAQANMEELNRIQDPLLQCSFLRAYAEYRWSLERPDWEGGLEAMKKSLEIAEQHRLRSQRRKIADEIKQSMPRAMDQAKILQQFLEKHNLADSSHLFGKG